MIRVYDETGITVNNRGALVINNNGLKTLHPLFAEITKVKDGDYYIEIEDLIENFEYYQKGMILKVNTPKTWGEYDFQCFRCDNPRVENNRVYCKAWHLYYDTKNYIIDGHWTIYNKTCDEAIKYFKNYVDYASKNPFDDTLSSNISTIPKNPLNNTDGIEIEIEDMSLYDVIEYLRDVYGGTLVRDNFKVAINSTIGEDRGVVLAYNKNITNMTAEENWDDVCTKILPYTMVGDTKITLNASPYNVSFIRWEDVSIEENPYGVPYSKIVEFENESGSEISSNVRDWLYNQAKAYLIANSVPKVNYKVSANIDNISDIGDTIHIKHPKILNDMYLNSTVMSIKYDAIREKYTEIEFGNFRRAIKNIFTETSALRGEITKTAEVVKGVSAVADKLTNSKVVLRDSDILVVDTLPVEEAVNCYRISNTGISFSNSGINGFSTITGSDGTIEANGSGSVGGLVLYNADKFLQIGSVMSGTNHKLRIRQKSGDTWGDWRFIQEEGSASGTSKEVVLFTGIGSYSKITFTQTIDNTAYSAIEIFYAIGTTGYDSSTFDHYQSVKVSVPVGKRVSLVSSAIDASDGVTIGVGIVKINADTITFEKNNAYKGSNMASTSNKNLVYIRKVVGYKV